MQVISMSLFFYKSVEIEKYNLRLKKMIYIKKQKLKYPP